jgi:hypothetical protein
LNRFVCLTPNEEGFGPAQLDKSSPNAAAIRGREQQLIDMHGGAQSEGGTSGNAIRGIHPNNPNYGHYMREGQRVFGTDYRGPVPTQPAHASDDQEKR